jgi:hypothetical protein
MAMDSQAFELTRRALHGLAELALAGPQYAACGDIRLRATPGGFGTVADPDVRVDGLDLVVDGVMYPLEGSIGEIAGRASLTPRELSDVYSEGPGVPANEPLFLDADAAALIADAFARADVALRAMSSTEEPVLWPEHFDIGITIDEVNYGVSPGDRHVSEPYAYVGPWKRRRGSFWNMPFGAVTPLRQLPDAEAVEAFFRKGASRAASDPLSDS